MRHYIFAFTIFSLGHTLLFGEPAQEKSLETTVQAQLPVAQNNETSSGNQLQVTTRQPSFVEIKQTPWLDRVSQWFSSEKQPTKSQLKLKGLVGFHDEKIDLIIEQLKEGNTFLLLNRLILHGPPGNGKSSIARAIATEAGWRFADRLQDGSPVKGPNIVTSYQGDGPTKVQKIFQEAADLYAATGECSVIFIDEIDAIAQDATGHETTRDHKLSMQSLWLSLDEYKHHPGIFFICATNHFKKLNATFLDRFGSNVIEIGNPDADTRTEILNHYLNRYRIKLDAQLFQELVNKTKGCSIRALEDLCGEIRLRTVRKDAEITDQIIWQALKKSRSKTRWFTLDPETMRKWHEGLGLAFNFTGLLLNLHHIKQIAGEWSTRPSDLILKSRLYNPED